LCGPEKTRSGTVARKQSTVWFIEHLKNDTGHGTQKPVECMRRPILNNSSPGQAVYEPFCGSGTTLIAAHMEGRVCLALELNPLYCDVIVERWQEFTGEQARLEGDGDTFAEVKNNRHGGQTNASGKVKQKPGKAAAKKKADK
jgi:adenine specific DNA methylase Mod